MSADNKKITKARITESKDIFDVPQVMVVYEGSEEEVFLFSYYPDEISFTADEFIGLTEAEATNLKFKKDKAYLQS